MNTDDCDAIDAGQTPRCKGTDSIAGADTGINERRVVPAFGLILVFMAVTTLIGCADNDPPTAPDGGTAGLKVEDFRSAETCRECHPDHVDQWEGSMHAYAMKDPVWLAVLDVEWTETNGAVDQFCIQCHSPIGFVTGVVPPFTDVASLPAVVREGITCTVCHAMALQTTGVDDAGAVYFLDPTGPQRGTLLDPIDTNAHASATSPLLSRSAACLPCHDLYIGDNRAEITYTEWVESFYAPMGFECQDCHMPQFDGPAATDGPLRTNHDHRMIGVDVALIDFPDAGENRQLVADLLSRSVRVELRTPDAVARDDSLAFQIEVLNTGAGHSIPSGASFLREMWLEVVVATPDGDTLLASGLRDAQHNVVADPFLHTFQSTIETAGPSLTSLTSIDNSPLIPAFGSRSAVYGARIPPDALGPLEVTARVLFRSFAPGTLRSVGLDDLVDHVADPFVMDTRTTQVMIEP